MASWFYWIIYVPEVSRMCICMYVCISFYSVIAFSRWNGYTLSRSLSLEKPFITDGIGIKPTKITKIIENDQWRKRRSNEMLFVRVVRKNWTERKLSWCLKFRKINIYRKKFLCVLHFANFWVLICKSF